MGWNYPKVGREKQAGELFQATIAYWTEQQKKGNIEGFEPVLLASHGGDLNGFFVVKGTTEKLDMVRRDDKFLKLIMQLNLSVDGVGVTGGWHGDELMDMMGRWGKLI